MHLNNFVNSTLFRKNFVLANQQVTKACILGKSVFLYQIKLFLSTINILYKTKILIYKKFLLKIKGTNSFANNFKNYEANTKSKLLFLHSDLANSENIISFLSLCFYFALRQKCNFFRRTNKKDRNSNFRGYVGEIQAFLSQLYKYIPLGGLS